MSTQEGCPVCGFSWPPLDSRYFSQNSIGRCLDCDGFGSVKVPEEDFGIDSHLHHFHLPSCKTCDGTGLNPELDSLTLGGRSLRSLYHEEICDLERFIEKVKTLLPAMDENDAFATVLRELKKELTKMIQLGLGHLQLSRRIGSLSNGEKQRLRLSGILIEPLSGVLYVLDEPSQGLHPADLDLIWENINHLKDLGNTIVIVDHDDYFWKKADFIMELGPGGGVHGGDMVANFAPSCAKQFVKTSQTAAILTQKPKLTLTTSDQNQDFIHLRNIAYRHLKINHLCLLKQGINVVSGVSGVGKTSLVMGVLAENVRRWQLCKRNTLPTFEPYGCESIKGLESTCRGVIVNRKPMAKSSISITATYLNCMQEVRNFYAQLPASLVAGLTKKHFSLMNDLGRCPFCRGKGYITHSMRFLSDTLEKCPHCQGRRFQDHILSVTYQGHSLSDLLDLTLEEVADVFKNHPKIKHKLDAAIDLGLGYLKFGQPSKTLSGGEAQRLKMATYLHQKRQVTDILFIDEPTRGLHHQDVQCLIQSLKKILSLGCTVVMVEHSFEVIRACDWLIDLGEGPGKLGGKVIFQGNLSSLHQLYQKKPRLSLTAHHLFSSLILTSP